MAQQPSTNGDTVMPDTAGRPLALGGVCVMLGDDVYIDASGGVVIPPADVACVLIEARQIEAEDAAFAECIRAEHPDARHRGGT